MLVNFNKKNNIFFNYLEKKIHLLLNIFLLLYFYLLLLYLKNQKIIFLKINLKFAYVPLEKKKIFISKNLLIIIRELDIIKLSFMIIMILMMKDLNMLFKMK